MMIFVPIANSPTIFITITGGSHSVTKASTAYCANDKQMIAICDGFNTKVDTQENRNAGAAPNASIKYAHSAPEDVFIVPNSAYARAPVSKNKQKNKNIQGNDLDLYLKNENYKKNNTHTLPSIIKLIGRTESEIFLTNIRTCTSFSLTNL